MTKPAVKYITLDGKDYGVVAKADLIELIEAAEAIEDVRLFDAAVARAAPEDFLTDAELGRILDGESEIRVWREHRSLTLPGLAAKAAISKGFLSELETKKKEPSLDVLRRIAAALDLGLDDLVSVDAA